MIKQAMIRLLVAAAIAGGAHEVHSQTSLPMPQLGPASGEPAPGEHPGFANGPLYGIGGVIGTIGVVGIWNQSQVVGCCGNQVSMSPSLNPPGPPGTGGSGGGGGAAPGGGGGGGAPPGGGGGGQAPRAPASQALRAGCNPPPVGETRFVMNEVVFDIPTNVSSQTITNIAARHDLTPVETSTLRLTGRTLRRWRIDNGAPVADVIRDVCTNAADRAVAGAQPNYLYALAQSQQEPVNSPQYAPEKLKLVDAHRLADGNKVLVAVISGESEYSAKAASGAFANSL